MMVYMRWFPNVERLEGKSAIKRRLYSRLFTLKRSSFFYLRSEATPHENHLHVYSSNTGHLLLRLPRKPSVETILREYYSHCLATATEETKCPLGPSLASHTLCREEGSGHTAASVLSLRNEQHGRISLTLLAEVLDGVKIYFDFMLADHLLYSQEKAQYKNVVEENRAPMSSGDHDSAENSHCLNSSAENSCTTNSDASSKMDVDQKPVAPLSSVLMPSSVYGVEHLLRLFVRMPLFLAQAQLPTSHVHTLHQYWKDLLGYICSRRQELFSEDHYEDVAVLLLQPPSTPSLQTTSEKSK